MAQVAPPSLSLSGDHRGRPTTHTGARLVVGRLLQELVPRVAFARTPGTEGGGAGDSGFGMLMNVGFGRIG